jgi:ABC-2 type transport system ATP-binding protein
MVSDGRQDADDPVVVLSDVRRRFGEQGLHGLDLQVPPGTIVGLVGPSGSGKTTAVRIVLGLDEPEDGDVFVFERRPTDFSRDDRRRIGYMPQSVALYTELSLRHNLDLVASLYGMPWRGRWIRSKRRRRARGRVDDTLEFLGLTGQQRTKLADASGGEQRRLALAAAMVHEPSLLVLDEPTAGIDPVLRREIWSRLEQLRDEGVTVFVTTQYVEEATHCDLVTVLTEGEVLVTDTPRGLRQRAFGDDPPPDASFEDVFVALIRRHEDERRTRGSSDARRDAGEEATRG